MFCGKLHKNLPLFKKFVRSYIYLNRRLPGDWASVYALFKIGSKGGASQTPRQPRRGPAAALLRIADQKPEVFTQLS